MLLRRLALIVSCFVISACDRGAAGTDPVTPETLVASLGEANDPFPLTAAVDPAAGSASGALAGSASHFYRLTVPAGHSGLRVAAACSDLCSVYVRRTSPTAGTLLGQTVDQTGPTVFVATASTTADNNTYIEVRAKTAAITYALRADPRETIALTWDPGTSQAGTQVVTQPDTVGGDYAFRITAQASTWGAWRSVLTVGAGEADLYLGTNSIPAVTATHRSTRPGSDGLVLAASQYSAGASWAYRIRATPGTTFSLLSGTVHVRDLGTLANDGSSAADLAIGPEGAAWFRLQSPAEAKGWRIMTRDDVRVLVNDTGAPVAGDSTTWDIDRMGQALVVPPYLAMTGYVVALVGAAGAVHVDNRFQAIRIPSALPGGSNDFDFDLSGTDDAGFRYVTYQVDVPVSAIVWQAAVRSLDGDVDLYVQQGAIPNEQSNLGLSEVVGTGIADSVTLVPATLTNGLWYITVKAGAAPLSFTLTSGEPTVTDIAFVNQDPTLVPNGLAFEDQVGWRFFRVPNIAQQVGALGWILELVDQVPGTEIAVRRNAVPGRWQYRANSTTTSTGAHADASSTLGFLERPNHPADIWYVGVNQPEAPLGAFRLRTLRADVPTLDMNTGSIDVSGQPSGRWRWFRVPVPASALGWDLRLEDVTGGSPRMVVRSDFLPEDYRNDPSVIPLIYINQWQSGWNWAVAHDFTGRQYGPDGPGSEPTEQGRRAVFGMGRPLQEGTYFVGVSDLYATPTGAPMSYRIQSRGIGQGTAPGGGAWSLPVEDVAIDGEPIAVEGLAAREVAWFRVVPPLDAEGLGFEMITTSGEAMMSVGRTAPPNSSALDDNPSDFTSTNDSGRRQRQTGPDFHYIYPTGSNQTIPVGPYYYGVASEGQSPSDTNHIGTGTSSFQVRSRSASLVLGGVDTVLSAETPLVFPDQTLLHGQQRAYRFTVPAGLSHITVHFEDVEGHPIATASKLPIRFPTINPPYDAEEGGSTQVGQPADADETITLADPSGTYTVLVATNTPAMTARYKLVVSAWPSETLAFNGGSVAVTGHKSQTWRYYQVEVPPGALGWDLRLTNVTSGAPRLVVSRDTRPDRLSSACTIPSWTERNTWGSGCRWAPTQDLTGRSLGPGPQGANQTQLGQVFTVGMGAPLNPGTYFVGVIDTEDGGSTTPLAYTLVSRGIGIGNDGAGLPWGVQVQDLAFEAEATVTDLAPREIAWFRVPVPANAKSWDVELLPTVGEGLFAVRKGNLPNMLAAVDTTSDSIDLVGTLRRKTGPDYFYKYPATGQTTIPSGDYYIAAVSEGGAPTSNALGSGPASFAVKSKGEVDVRVAASPLAVGQPLLWTGQSLRYGEHRAFRWQAPAGLVSMEIKLENVNVGTADLRVVPGESVFPTFSYTQQDYPAGEGGASGSVAHNGYIVTIPEPNGWYTALVVAERVGTVESPLEFDLRVTALGEAVLPFNGGEMEVEAQTWNTWRYFRVDVPSDALGWDLRLEAVTSGTPRMVIKKADLPANFSTTGNLMDGLDWKDGEQWYPGTEYTRRTRPPLPATTDEVTGRIAVMGMGGPLVPGTYYVGVSGGWAASGNPLSYRLVSRGIGAGTDSTGAAWRLPVIDLPWKGQATVSDVPPRFGAYYRVTVPADAATVGFELVPTSGEGLLMVKKGTVPTSYSVSGNFSNTAVSTTSSWALDRTKSGPEFYYRYETKTAQRQGAGVWFLAAVGEGDIAPADFTKTNIGTGTSSFVIKSLGEGNVGSTTETVISTTQGVTIPNQTLRYGEHNIYHVRVEKDVRAYEVRLKNRVGNPWLSAVSTGYNMGASPAVSTAHQEYIASEGGHTPLADDVAVTFAESPGDITIVVNADILGTVQASAGYDLVVTPRAIQDAEWRGGRVTANLADSETAFFKFIIPNDCDGVPLAGWILTPENTNGSFTVRTMLERLPDAANEVVTFVNANQVVVTPPDVGPGTWYVSVESGTLANITLHSEELTELRYWEMPARGVTPSTPGVAPPYFADTGTRDDGSPVGPVGGDRGTDLEHGHWHFYRVVVPEGNGGVLSTYLEALSGEPQAYLRRNAAPADDTTRRNWEDELLNTTYGHIVPLDTRKYAGMELEPGHWWLGVHAPSSNVRYRLALSSGLIQDLAQDGGQALDQELAGGDMRHYRVHIPAASTTEASSTPLSWDLDLVQDQGDVFVYLRQEVPTGLMPANVALPVSSGSNTNIKDWADDRANVWGTAGTFHTPILDDPGRRTLTVPPIAPGVDYIVSVYARTDARFDLLSSIGATRLHLDDLLDYKTGLVDIQLAPGEQRLYRIDLPADAARYWHDATIGTGIYMFLHMGTVPPTTSSPAADWSNNGGTTTAADHSAALYGTSANIYNFPWMPGRSYYLLVQNRDATNTRQFKVQMKGYDKTGDSDADLLPDWWEYDHFASLTNNGTNQASDNDELSLAEEYQRGTNPTEADTDGDLLFDGLEVSLGTDPLVGDSDGDLCCDGDDPDPLAYDEVCYIIRLTMHQYTPGAWGTEFGTNEHRRRIPAVFASVAGVPHWVHIRAYDIDEADEVSVYVNGHYLGILPPTGNDEEGRPILLWIDDAFIRTGDNWIELRQKDPGERWGVTDLGLFTYGDPFGYDGTRAYDTLNPEGLTMYWYQPVEGLFEVQSFDSESAGEVRVTLNGTALADLPASGELAWGKYLQLPIESAQLGAGPAIIDIDPVGGDGTWQFKLLARRALTNITFSSTMAGDENDHARTSVNFLFPFTAADRELKFEYLLTPADGSVAMSGTNVPDTTLPARTTLGNVQFLCSAADVVDYSWLTHQLGVTSPNWNVKVTYYGDPLDFDLDGFDDCVDCAPKIPNGVGPGQVCDSPDDDDLCVDDVYACAGGDVACVDVDSGGATEDICDGLDNDCDGATDEDFVGKGEACDGEDADACEGGRWACSESGLLLVCNDAGAVPEGAVEGQACDGASDADSCKEGRWVCAEPVEGVSAGLLCDDAATTEPSGAVEGARCDGGDSDTCAGGTWGCDAAGTGLVCSDDAESLTGQGAACDGSDSDTCAGGKLVCDAAGTGLECDDDLASLTAQGTACDGDDADTCKGGTWGCDLAGTGLVCSDDLASLSGQGAACDGDDSDTCAGGRMVCDAAGTGLECDDDPASLTQQGQACDGNDGDTCAGGKLVCDAAGTGLVCDDDASSLAGEGQPCDGADADTCADGVSVCDAAGTGLACSDDANSLAGEGTACDGADGDTCAGGVLLCEPGGTTLVCSDDAASLSDQGKACDGADSDTCAGGTWLCDAAGTGLTCSDDAASLIDQGKACDGADSDTCAGGTWLCDAAGTGLTCSDDAGSLSDQGRACDGADSDTCTGGTWGCDAAGTGLVCSDDAASLTLQGEPCDGDDVDSCPSGQWVCDAAGKGLVCTDDAPGLELEGSACDGADDDSCRGGIWVCGAGGATLECTDDAASLAGEGAACDGDDGDTCLGGRLVCDAAGTGLVCDDDAATLGLEGTACDGDDRDSCPGGRLVCDAAGTGLACDDDPASLDDESEPCDGADDDTCAGGVWVCDPAGTGLTCTDDDAALALEGQACDGEDADRCPDGTWVCAGEGLSCTDDAASTVEVCNARDDDCDGATDEDFPFPQTEDGDCDGVPTGLDCDDDDQDVRQCPVPCVDVDEDGHDARTGECPSGDDCDDADASSTWLGVDADCDAHLAEDDCDDHDPARGAIAADLDCDDVLNEPDNCPTVVNPDQADDDHDGVGQVCDLCLDKADPAQKDGDGDGVGDACDACPGVVDDQSDADGDGFGDACDVCVAEADDQADGDGDGVGDACDVCPSEAGEQADGDGDGVGDACDVCPAVADDQADADEDGFGDACDVCPAVADDQVDINGNGLGDLCDPDMFVASGSGACDAGGGELGLLLGLAGLALARRGRRRPRDPRHG